MTKPTSTGRLLRRAFTLFFALLFFATGTVFADDPTTPSQSSALQDQNTLHSQGIDYFDLNPTTSSSCTSSGDGIALRGSTNPEKAFNYFLDVGLTPEQVSGIFGNLATESGFDPLILQATGTDLSADQVIAQGYVSNGNTGWGIAQWTPPDKIISTLQKQGKTTAEIGSLAVQLNFLWKSLDNEHAVNYKDILAAADGGDPNLSAAAALKKADTPAHAADVIFAAFERPLTTESLPGREQAAEDAFKKYGGGGGGGTGGTDCGGVTGPTAGANLLALPAGATGHNVYYANQFSDLSKYSDLVDPNYDFHTCGCGPTSALMIQLSLDSSSAGKYDAKTLVSLLNGIKAAGGFKGNAGYCGTSDPGLINYFQQQASKYTVETVHAEVKGTNIDDSVIAQMKTALSQGYILMVDVRGYYSYTTNDDATVSSGHHTVIYGYDSSGFYVANPGWHGDTLDSSGKPFPIPASKIKAIATGVYGVKGTGGGQ